MPGCETIVTSLTDEALRGDNPEPSSMPIHMAELGSDNYEQEFTLSLLASEEETLGLIDRALVRIENETYGTCESCGERFPRRG